MQPCRDMKKPLRLGLIIGSSQRGCLCTTGLMRHTIQGVIDIHRLMQYEVIWCFWDDASVRKRCWCFWDDASVRKRCLLGCLLKLKHVATNKHKENIPMIRASYRMCTTRVFHSTLLSKKDGPAGLNIQ